MTGAPECCHNRRLRGSGDVACGRKRGEYQPHPEHRGSTVCAYEGRKTERHALDVARMMWPEVTGTTPAVTLTVPPSEAAHAHHCRAVQELNSGMSQDRAR